MTIIEQWINFYQKQGFSIIPLKEKDKKPNIPTWQQYQKTKPTDEEITKWIEQGLFQNIGIICGQISNDLVVIDIDDQGILEELGLKIETILERGHWVARTGKGYHIYCKHFQDPGNINKDDNLHIEYRANGGYVVAPPSIHPNGAEYRFLYDKSPETLNLLIAEDVRLVFNDMQNRLSIERGIKKEPKKTVKDLKKGVKYGTRNDSAFKLACQYRDAKLTVEEATKLLMDWNRKNHPPLHDSEILSCIKSAYKDEKPPCQGEDRKKLLSKYKVFSYKEVEDKTTGEKRYVINGINYPRLSKLLMESDQTHYVSIKDNQEIWVYNGSFYEPLGQGILENRVGFYLDDLTTKKGKQEVVDFVRNYNYINREELNPPINLVNLKNGIYNIDTGEVTPHISEIFFTNELPIIYNPDAKIDKIEKFFETTLNLDDVPTIQEWFGDCIIRNYNRKKALLLVGATDTGKSKLLGLLGLFLGLVNTSNVSLHDLCKDKFAPVEMYSKYANICGDVAAASIRQIAMFLQTTGGDRIRGQQKYGKPFYFINYAKLVFSCNIIPDTEVKDDAYYNRWIVIECSNQFDDETKNQNILEEISTEEELSGLFNWAIEGWKRLKKNGGYKHYRSLEEVKEFMQKGKNPIREFVDTYIVSNPASVVTKEQVYKCYISFCKEYNYPIKESNVFSRKFRPLCPRGIDEGQQLKGGKKTWKGIECNYDFPGEQQELMR